MLTLYLVALGLGGTLLLASLLLGGEQHADAAGDVDIDADVDLDAAGGADAGGDHGVGADAALAWLPLASMRFWIFFLAFFGLTGALLSVAGFANPVFTGLVAGGVGYVCGLGVVLAIRRMRASQTSSTAGVDDYVGASALVMVSVAPGKPGKVRLEVKGRTVELLAETEDERPFAVQELALIYAVNDNGRAVITRADRVN